MAERGFSFWLIRNPRGDGGGGGASPLCPRCRMEAVCRWRARATYTISIESRKYPEKELVLESGVYDTYCSCRS